MKQQREIIKKIRTLNQANIYDWRGKHTIFFNLHEIEIELVPRFGSGYPSVNKIIG